MSMDNMREYRVTLHEEPGDKFLMIFECWSDDPDHAEEQALDAYPGAEVINVFLKEDVE
jgi:hypothetical protein